MSTAALSAVNFIPPQRLRARAARARVRAWAVAVAGLAVALGAAQVALMAQGAVPGQGVGPELARVRAVLDTQTRERAALDARIARSESQLALVRAIGTHPDWSVLLQILARERGDKVVLERVALRAADPAPGPAGATPSAAAAGAAPTPAPARPEAYTIRIAGQARSQGDATRYTRALEDLGLFDSVRILETHLVPIDGREYVSFQIECAISARAGARAPRPDPAPRDAGPALNQGGSR